MHEISNNVVCATSKGSDQPAQSDQSLCKSLEYSMIVKLLTEHHLEFSKLKMGLQRLVRVNTCQNATLLELSCHGSIIYCIFSRIENIFSLYDLTLIAEINL